jgi:hypothetical protein
MYVIIRVQVVIHEYKKMKVWVVIGSIDEWCHTNQVTLRQRKRGSVTRQDTAQMAN